MHRGRRRFPFSETSARGDDTSVSPSAKNAGRARARVLQRERACYVSDHDGKGAGRGGEGADVTRRCSACPRCVVLRTRTRALLIEFMIATRAQSPPFLL